MDLKVNVPILSMLKHNCLNLIYVVIYVVNSAYYNLISC